MWLLNKIHSFVHELKKPEKIPIPYLAESQNLLKGKTALITGGGSGIGLEIAKAFTSHGCKVVICGRNVQKLEKACSEMENCRYCELDILKVDSFSEKIQQAAESIGTECFDILVNSAGVNQKLNFAHMTQEEYDRIMDTNMKGTYFMSWFVAQRMIEKQVKGHILNISSSSALRPAWGPYQLSKWAVKGFTLGLASELIPYGITVNAVAPGKTATPMLGFDEDRKDIYCEDQPSKRYIIPQEIANMAVFLCSDMGNMVVGDTVYLTGGSGTISIGQ